MNKLKLLISNIFFAPKSFGGATIVAEELAIRLKESWDILVVTTENDSNLPEYNLRKYREKGLDILAINLHHHTNKFDIFMNPKFADEFSKILAIFKPDIAHIHCIQNMGAEMLEALHLEKVPFVVTIHDNWWICERQFMINKYEEYCWQEKLDLSICEKCVSAIDSKPGNYSGVKGRFNYLTNKLKLADLLLFPSEFQKNLYEKNLEISQDKLLVNKNGIKFPDVDFKKSRSKKIRFGFVGGIGPIKGIEQITMAFNEIEKSNYELVLVDNTLNLGFSSMNIDSSKFQGTVKIVPSYTQDTMDEFFDSIDVLLFPSQWKESFGLTVREAMSRDVWVIATNSGGVVEDIINGENGTIIPLDGDYKPLKKAIEEILEKDFSTYENIHKDKIFSYEDQAEHLDSIIKKLIGKTYE